MKLRIVSLILALALMGVSASSAAAQTTTTQVTRNGAAGLVATSVSALNNINVQDSEIDVAVVELNNSLNNLQALNNVLNNNDVDVTVQDIDVLTGAQIDILRNALQNADIDLDAVVGVAVLSDQDFLVFTRK